MKNLISLFCILFMFSCSEMVDKPKNLLNKDEMAELIADFAIYDQSYVVNPEINMEQTSRFVLKKHHIKAQDYRDSYKYYLSHPAQLDKILEKAKAKILEKDPELETYLEKKKKDHPNVPSFVK